MRKITNFNFVLNLFRLDEAHGSSSESSDNQDRKKKKKQLKELGSPKVEVSKNKLLIKWGGASNSSSESEGRKTRSMSKGDSLKEEVIPKEHKKKKKTEKAQVPEKSIEQKHLEIMQQFLEEKDQKKWKFFIEKLDKEDAKVLKRLLSKDPSSTSESEQEPKHAKRDLKKEKQKKDEKEELKKEDEIKKENGGQKGKFKKQKEKEPKIKQEEVKEEIGAKNEPKIKQEVKEENGEKNEPKIKQEEVNEENGNNEEKEAPGNRQYYVMIAGKKTLVKIVSDDEKEKESDKEEGKDSDKSLVIEDLPQKQAPLYVLDSDEEPKNKPFHQVDGNGSSVEEIYGCSVEEISGSSVEEISGSSVEEMNGNSVEEMNGNSVEEIQHTGDKSASNVNITFSSVEETGDRISLAPASGDSNVTLSDTTAEKSISDSLAEVFGDSHADSHETVSDNHVVIVEGDDRDIKKELCTKCYNMFFTFGALEQHMRLAHRDDSHGAEASIGLEREVQEIIQKLEGDVTNDETEVDAETQNKTHEVDGESANKAVENETKQDSVVDVEKGTLETEVDAETQNKTHEVDGESANKAVENETTTVDS